MLKFSNPNSESNMAYTAGTDDLKSTLQKVAAPPVDPVSGAGATISDTEILDTYDPVSSGSATGEAATRVQQKKEDEGGDVDPLSPKSTVIQDACVVVGLVALTAAAAIFSAPLVVTVGLAAIAVATTVDIVSHRAQGDQSSFISRPGSIVRSIAVGVGASVAAIGGVGAAFAGVGIATIPAFTVEDDGSTIINFTSIREKLRDWRNWIMVLLAAIIPFMLSRTRFKHAISKGINNTRSAFRLKFKK